MTPRQNREIASVVQRTREQMQATALNAGQAAVGSVAPFDAGESMPGPEVGLVHDQERHMSPHDSRISTGYAPVGLKRVSIVEDRSERLRNSRESSRSRRSAHRR